MNILIAQPIHETNTNQLEEEMKRNQDQAIDAFLFPEGYLANEESVEQACSLAKTHSKMIITGYRDKNKKDRAIIINRSGEVILDRAKTPSNEKLYRPSVVEADGHRIGFLLCVELLQGLEGLEAGKIDCIAHPIGVGMFSEEQFDEWINEAKKVAHSYNTMIIGTSHADGSFRNCGVSIPIAYCIDKNGEAVFISKHDLRTRIVNMEMETKKLRNYSITSCSVHALEKDNHFH